MYLLNHFIFILFRKKKIDKIILIKEQNVIDYIQTKYPGYLLINFDPLERQIRDAISKSIANSGDGAPIMIQKNMLSRDWDGQI